MSGTEVILKFVAILVAIYGLGLQWWGFFADRRQDRRRCPKCWYDMSGTKGRRCSECGKTAKREVDLLQRRPRYKALALGIIMLLGSVFLFVVADQGYQRMIPDRMLVWMAPSFAGTGGTLEREFERRLRTDQLTDAEWVRAVKGVLAELEIPIWSLEVVTRDQWPADMPLEAAFQANRTPTGVEWIDVAAMQLTVTPNFGTAQRSITFQSRSAGTFYSDQQVPASPNISSEDGRTELVSPLNSIDFWRQFVAPTGGLPNREGSASFDVAVALDSESARGAPPRGGRGQPRLSSLTTFVEIETGTVSVEVATTGRVSDVLDAVAPEVDGEDYLDLRITVSSAPRRPDDNRRDLRLVRSVGPEVVLREGVVIPIAIDLRFDGQVIARGTIVWVDSITLRRMSVGLTFDWIAAPVALYSIPDSERERWSAVGRIDPILALRLFDHDRYLDIDGEFEIPIEW